MYDAHDNLIISYEVNLDKEKIIIRTKYNYYLIDLIFSGVLAHYFENEIYGSVIFEITKRDLNEFLKHNSDLLKAKRNYNWPIYYDTTEHLMEILIKEQYSYYMISASYGLRGWVLAKEYRFIQMQDLENDL